MINFDDFCLLRAMQKVVRNSKHHCAPLCLIPFEEDVSDF